ncbi:serine/threonine-protein kinase Rad53p [Monosporozyma servazzii]
MNETQPTQLATQATQKYLVEKFTQEHLNENIVFRVICTSGQIPIKDFTAEPLTVLTEKQPIKRIWTFGRNSGSDYHLGNITRLSNKHFAIMLGEDGNLLLKDTSTNGTWLNGQQVDKNTNQLLSQGDEITVGLGVQADVVSVVIFVNDKFKQKLEQLKLHGVEHGDGSSTNINIKNNKNNVNSSSTLNGLVNKRSIHDKYFIQDEVVGSGAFATVKKAVERSTGKTFAVKMINRRKVMGNFATVARELEVLKKLNHSRIVTLEGFYEDQEYYYMLMEFVSGGDLMDFVAAHGAVGEDAGREITRQILEAVKYIHSMGISHRDLKPDNILIEQDDPVLVKLTDFGLAKVEDAGSRMKTFCGTMAYVAPEIIEGNFDKPTNDNEEEDKNPDEIHSPHEHNEYSSLVDMWSMGCLVYVILTGHLPFSGSKPKELYSNISRGSYHEGPLKDCRISGEARDFIDSLLQVDPNNRLSAEKALEHPWIKMREFTDSFPSSNADYDKVSMKESQSSQVSLMESLAQQSILQNLDEKDYEMMKAKKELKLQQLELDHIMEKKGFKVPTQPPIRFTQPQAIPTKAVKESNKPTEQQMKQSQRKAKNSGKFLTLKPIDKSGVKKKLVIGQGVNAFFIGRSDVCTYSIPDSRLSRVHCFILKKRHPIGQSIYESPAQGLDDIWYCHAGSNVSYVNDKKLSAGQKTLLHDGDEIKVIYDPEEDFVIAYKVEVNDGTGLFNDGISDGLQDSLIVPQTGSELKVAKRLLDLATENTNMSSVKKAETPSQSKTDLAQKSTTPFLPTSPHVNKDPNSHLVKQHEPASPSVQKEVALPLQGKRNLDDGTGENTDANIQTSRVKRAKLDHTTGTVAELLGNDQVNMQFM